MTEFARFFPAGLIQINEMTLIADEVVNAAYSTLLIGPRKGCQIAVNKPCRLSLKIASCAQANAKLNP
jgi:hypothetical protein